MPLLKNFTMLLVVVTLVGCAHPMVITSDVTTLVPAANTNLITKNAGLYISSANKAKHVTTAGGGGDRVSYSPYADMETGIYKMLSNVFQNVTLLHSPEDSVSISRNSLSFVVEPEIATKSWSTGVFTWMATDFTVDLSCKITDPVSKATVTVSTTGTGHAEFSELKSNFSLAGQRASQDALQKMQAQLLKNIDLRK